MCAGSDGQGTSGLKMEPKCITTDSDIGTGKPLCAPTGGRSIVREIQCAEGKGCRKKRMPLCNAMDKDSNFVLSERRQTSGACLIT